MERTYTKVTLENENGIFSVQLDQVEMTLHDMVELLVEPALLAAGFSQGLINECLREGAAQ
jgi:hypothetical protein